MAIGLLGSSIYAMKITVNLCNQGIREIPKPFRDYQGICEISYVLLKANVHTVSWFLN